MTMFTVLGCSALYSQDEIDEDEVFVLSPFEVESTSGYVATQTLAGTRLRTELRNVPQQITVMTQEFIEDVAATTPQDVMLYSMNVENLQEFSDPFSSGGDFNQGINFNSFGGRIRGIASVGRMRDFFETNLQGDTYNIDQITISSGPNAVIYGLAGTGGVQNSSYKDALVDKDMYSIQFRADSEDSFRTILDLNQTIIEDKLAIRFIGLMDDFETYRTSTWGEQDRYFLTATARPWKGANLNVYYEDVDIEKVLPRNVVAYDGGVSRYRQHVAAGGDPFYDNSIDDGILPGWENIVETIGNNRDHYVLQNPENVVVNIGPAGGGDRNMVQTIEPEDFAEPSDRFPWSLPPNDPIVSPEHNLHGATTGRHMYGEIYGAIFSQTLWENLAIELGYNREKGFTDFWNMAQPGAAKIRVDPNMYLPDKVTPNPWKGMMYVEHLGQSTTDYNEAEGYRATASYNLDLRDVSKWLGRHQLMGLYTFDSYDRFWSWIRTRTIPQDQIDTYKYDRRSNRAAGQTWYRWYIDPDTYEMINPFDPLNGGLQPDGTFVIARGNAPASGFTWSSLAERKGLTGAIQSFWLNERLVTTLGYRKGWFRNGTATVELLRNTEDVALGFQNIRDVDRSKDTYGDETSEDAINYGGVLHLTREDNKFGGWSVFYNFADIFNSPTPSHFADGSGIPAAIGESYDYGLMWSGFDGRYGIKVNYYKTTSENDNTCNWCDGIRNNVVGIEKQIGAPGKQSDNENPYNQRIADGEIVDANGNTLSEPVGYNPSTFDYEQPLSYWHMVANRESKGWEIEGYANPTDNWTLRLTAAKNEASDVDGLRGWKDWINERYNYWLQWAEWEQSAYDEDNLTQTLAESGGSVTNRFNELAPSYVTLNNADGVQVNQNAGWRVNFTARYSFNEGALDGLNVGGIYRWRESPVIGYLSLPSDTPFPEWPDQPATFTAPSLENPVEAPDREDFDLFASYSGMMLNNKVRYRIQLNIRNVFDDQSLVPQRPRTDGTIAVYTYKQPRTFILSVKFTY